jgi:hypothetical protein
MLYWNLYNVNATRAFRFFGRKQVTDSGMAAIERVSTNMLLIPQCGTTPMPRLSSPQHLLA